LWQSLVPRYNHSSTPFNPTFWTANDLGIEHLSVKCFTNDMSTKEFYCIQSSSPAANAAPPRIAPIIAQINQRHARVMPTRTRNGCSVTPSIFQSKLNTNHPVIPTEDQNMIQRPMKNLLTIRYKLPNISYNQDDNKYAVPHLLELQAVEFQRMVAY